MTLPVVFTANGPSGYNLTKSLRFRSSASAYLNRTFGTPTSTTTWSLSFWLKRGNLTANAQVFSAGGDFIYFGGGTFLIKAVSGAVLETTQVFRDPSAWYHFLVVADTSNATANNRVRLYVNGTEVTAFSSRTNPSLSAATIFNASSSNNRIGGTGSTEFYDGYLADVNFIDGQALTPSSFGETSTTTGVWIPKKYTGTYGTNGFYLPFTDTTSTSTLGTDFSGNSNTWTVNNISLTSGSTYDSMTDVPTLTSATTANYCTLNAALQAGGYTLNDGNLNWARTGGTGGTNDRSQFGTIGVTSGKWYWEFTAGTVNANSIPGFGIAIGSASTQSWGGSQTGVYIYESDGLKYLSGTGSSYGATFTTGDIIGVAFNADAGTLTFYKNNTSQGQATSGLTSGPYFPAVTRTVGGGGSNGTEIANFGQRPFAYTLPTGFVALNTFNLPTPTIGATASTQANRYMDVLTWTGNGASSRAITGLNFQPDWVWDKMRSDAYQHAIVDAVRGGNRVLHSNSTSTEDVNWQYGYVSSFNSDGFTIQAGSTSSENWNLNGSTFVAWNWRASNATAVTNTAGSISSQVSANTTAGFSIVTYTGNATSGATVGHGLSVAPSMVILKSRSLTTNWYVYHSGLTSASYQVYLNLTSAQDNAVTTAFNNTAPGATTFTLPGTGLGSNNSGATYVAYCFAPIAGYSAFGSYVGNGSTDGPFIFTGFRPRYVLIKTSSAGTNGWQIRDTSRSPYNTSLQLLYADTSGAEISSAGNDFDILSNGFKVRNSGGDLNTNGGTYIYACFAENPFKYANAR